MPMIAIVQDLLAIVRAVLSAVASGDEERVQDILPAEFQIEIAQRAAKARALEKFGSG